MHHNPLSEFHSHLDERSPEYNMHFSSLEVNILDNRWNNLDQIALGKPQPIISSDQHKRMLMLVLQQQMHEQQGSRTHQYHGHCRATRPTGVQLN